MKKKIFSLMTTMVIVFGLTSVMPANVFATNTYYYNLSIGSNGVYTSDSSTIYRYVYTPTHSGTFYIDEIYFGDFDLLTWSTTNANATHITYTTGCHYNLQAGNTYYFRFTNSSYSRCYNTIDFYEVNYNKIGNLSLGSSVVSVNDSKYYQTYYYFRPSTSGTYKITSNNPNSDPVVLVTDADGNIDYCFDNEGGSDGVNYSETMYLYSNRSYFFSFYDNGYAYSNNITLSYVPPTVVTTTTTTKPTTTTRSASAVAKDKSAAQKAMKQAKIKKLTAKSTSKKKVTVTWKKVKKAVGYEVQVSTNKKFKKSKIIYDKLTSKKKLTVKKLMSGKTYYVRVRAYATYKDANNKAVKVYSKWIKKIRKVKVK